MDNWKSPKQDKTPRRDDAPLEERLRMLEAQLAEQRGTAGANAGTGAPAAAPEQHFWHPGMPTPEAPSVARLATISEDLDAHREQLRSAEISLVDKIADVDDERRRATVRLQKAWQSYRDDVDDRLRRRTWSSAALLVLFALLIGGALFFFYRQVGIAQQQMATELGEVREALARAPVPGSETDEQGPELAEQTDLAELTARLDALSDTVATLSEAWQQTERTPPPDVDAQQAADARIEAEIAELVTRQQLAAQELVSLHRALDAAQVADEGEQTTEAGVAITDPGTEITDDSGGEPLTMEPGTEVDANAGDGDAEEPSATEATTDNDGETAAASRGEQGTVTIGDAPFALQLVGFRSRNSLMRFAAHEDLPPQVYFRQETYRGRPWFVLIHSLHESTEEAATELSQLPTSLAQQVDPWIRGLNEGSQLTVLEAPRPN